MSPLPDHYCDLVEAFLLSEFGDEVAPLGLTTGQATGMIIDAGEAEDRIRSELAYRLDGRTPPYSPQARSLVVNFWLRGMPSDRIDHWMGSGVAGIGGCSDWEPESAAGWLAHRRLRPQSRDVVALHLAGATPSRISRDLGVGMNTVVGIIALINEKPHVDEVRISGRELRKRLVKMYGLGYSYKQMQSETGASLPQVRNAIAAARRRGEIRDYRPGAGLGRLRHGS